MAKLTNRFLATQRASRSANDQIHWDDSLPGFGLRVKPWRAPKPGEVAKPPAMSWVIQYRNRLGRSRRLTLGVANRMNPDEARRNARKRLSEVEHGADPLQAERDARTAAL